jgi:hypothetical protein
MALFLSGDTNCNNFFDLASGLSGPPSTLLKVFGSFEFPNIELEYTCEDRSGSLLISSADFEGAWLSIQVDVFSVSRRKIDSRYILISYNGDSKLIGAAINKTPLLVAEYIVFDLIGSKFVKLVFDSLSKTNCVYSNGDNPFVASALNLVGVLKVGKSMNFEITPLHRDVVDYAFHVEFLDDNDKRLKIKKFMLSFIKNSN